MLSKREQAKIRRRDEAALAKDEDIDWTPQLEREQENRGKEEGRALDACMHAHMHKYFDLHDYLPDKIIRHETNYCLCMSNPSWSRLPKTLTLTIILVSHVHIAIQCSLFGHNHLCTF